MRIQGCNYQFFTTPISTFGSLMENRSFEGDTLGYRFSLNGQEKDDEIYGKGNTTSAEFWEYDARLGRRWNVDPLTGKYPWQSPYSCFNNNPIHYIDPMGLEGEDVAESTPEPKKDKYERKYERWERRNASLVGALRTLAEKQKLFDDSQTFFGKMVRETRWAKRHFNFTEVSKTTGWNVKVQSPKRLIKGSTLAGVGSLNKTETVPSSGTMTINY